MSTVLPAVPGRRSDAAVRYPIPPEAPHGEVYLTSFGFTQMDVAASHRQHAARAPGRREQRAAGLDRGRAGAAAADPAGQQAVSPAFLNTDAGSGPVYTVPPAQRRVFDFYYAVPPPLDQPEQMGFFELSWQVDVAGRPIAQRTPFQRFEGRAGAYEPYPPYVFVGLGFGVGWWYGPGFPTAIAPSSVGTITRPTAGAPRSRLAWRAANGAAGWCLARLAAVGWRMARLAARWRHAARGRRLAGSPGGGGRHGR